MHDPLVVAFEIRRPWPRRSPSYDDDRSRDGRRWRISRGAFWTLAGRGWYFPSIITVWHREPGGRDSGEVCKHYRHIERPDGRTIKTTRTWRWHLHHWRIQILPLQTFRRWALTRCAWCGGRSRKGDRVDVSHQWDGRRGPWWRGELGLYHSGCSSVERAHMLCYCADPLFDHDGFGRCACCGGLRAWHQEPTDAHRMLRTLAKGQRIPAAMLPHLEKIWADLRAERETNAN
ncbi:hypothetical protein ACFWMR_01960 [Amycolatopsis thailandensis]|uniref:hypothetical protein n=1 Tax=Amycolatopsis thailandensis TaxID=589330 RepID=UPI00364BC398